MDNDTRRRIVRDAFPTSAMPRRVTQRLKWLDDLAWAIATDVAVTYGEMRRDGWPADAAVDHAGAGFLEWLNGRLESAVSVGLAFAQAVDEEAA